MRWFLQGIDGGFRGLSKGLTPREEVLSVTGLILEAGLFLAEFGGVCPQGEKFVDGVCPHGEKLEAVGWCWRWSSFAVGSAAGCVCLLAPLA
jgi:hypothetical protein